MPYNITYLSEIPHYIADSSPGTYWYLKSPPNDLFLVYVKLRKEHPADKIQNKTPKWYTNFHLDYTYTIDDLIYHEWRIEEFFFFWNANKKPIDQNVKIHEIELFHKVNEKKQDVVANYIRQKMNSNFQTPLLVGRYNGNIKDGLILNLPKNNTYHNKTIDYVYFDDEMLRVLSDFIKYPTIEDLLKIPNGAKKHLRLFR
ncbi:hypothetical protein ['Camptotheca acuminata' phytoplasma]|uniref:hypothetical protein n=1 Tax='Camptotheca acuminata' phytoplasma TaxID=3239192 RepID=UPI00351A92AA